MHQVILKVKFGHPPCGARATGKIQRGLRACHKSTLSLQTAGFLLSLLRGPGIGYFIGSIIPNKIVKKIFPEWCNSPVTFVRLTKQLTHRALVLFIYFFPSVCV